MRGVLDLEDLEDLEDVGLSFIWKGTRYFIAADKTSLGNTVYILACPGCGKRMHVVHQVIVGPYGVTLVNPSGPEPAFPQSLICPHRCGWHVRIRDGLATQA
ncbi:MAG: hypothetical protein ACYCT1_08230 [Steroidobacteraceae bacterium]